MWLWPPLIQRELDRYRVESNNHKQRKQKNKVLPSNISPELAYLMFEEYGGVWCLLPVDIRVVEEIMRDMKPEFDRLTSWGVSDTVSTRASAGVEQLGITVITLDNVWFVFEALLAFFANIHVDS